MSNLDIQQKINESLEKIRNYQNKIQKEKEFLRFLDQNAFVLTNFINKNVNTFYENAYKGLKNYNDFLSGNNELFQNEINKPSELNFVKEFIDIFSNYVNNDYSKGQTSDDILNKIKNNKNENVKILSELIQTLNEIIQNNKEKKSSKSNMYIIGGICIVILLALIYYYFIYKRKNKRN